MSDFVQVKKLTAEEYFATYPETTDFMELVDGEVVMAAAPSDDHQGISGNIHLIIGPFIRDKELGTVRYSPCDVHLDDHNVVQPDLFFVAKDNPNCKRVKHHWVGTPDFCIEIISPGSGKRDRVEKLDLYAKHGVNEFWIVEPDDQYIVVHVLKGDTFQRQGAYDTDQTFESPTFTGLTINVAEIFDII